MPKLFVVRHGEPTLKGTLLGRLDPGLSETGHRRAMEVLSGMQAEVAYVSPLRRAQETASYLPAAIERITIDELVEVSLGEWDGLVWAEVEARWPEIARRKLERWFHVAAPGGESWDDVAGRASSALTRIRQRPVAAIVVAHQGINSVLNWRLTGLDPQTYHQNYCEIVTHDI